MQLKVLSFQFNVLSFIFNAIYGFEMFLHLTIELKWNLWMIVYRQSILYHNPSWSQNHGFKMFLCLTVELKCNL